jgi:hypothetical protein
MADRSFNIDTSASNSFDPAFLISTSPGVPTVDAIRSKIQAWIGSSWFRELVRMFDEDIELDGGLDLTLERLEAFSERWDFRRVAR